MDWKKLTLTQQRHAFTIKSNVLQDKINKKKTKARFSRLEMEQVYSQRKR